MIAFNIQAETWAEAELLISRLSYTIVVYNTLSTTIYEHKKIYKHNTLVVTTISHSIESTINWQF